MNELDVRCPDRIELWEDRRLYQARFLNSFESLPGGTRFTVSADIALKG